MYVGIIHFDSIYTFSAPQPSALVVKYFSEPCETDIIERGKIFEQLLPSALRNFDENSFDITIFTLRMPLNISENTVKSVYQFLTSNGCFNVKTPGYLSGKKLIRFFQHIRRFWKEIHWIRNILLSYKLEKSFLGLFDCPATPLIAASVKPADVCIVQHSRFHRTT